MPFVCKLSASGSVGFKKKGGSMKSILGVIVLLISGVALSGLTGCGGTGATRAATSDVAGLEIAEQMSFVTASEESSASSLSVDFKLIPTGGDFTLDQPDIYVFDRSMEVLSLINEILCSFDGTQHEASEVLNQGPYIAMIDEERCSKDRSGGDNDQSSAQGTTLVQWICDSSREDNSSPQIVQCWIPGDASSEDPFDEIRAQVTITEGKSDEHPFGLFSMDFAGYLSDGTQTMTGNLSSIENIEGKLEFEFFIDGGELFAEKTHAILAPDGLSGKAFASRRFSFEGFSDEGEVQVAFDESHYLSDFGGGDIELRDRLNFDENVWEYNLYTSDGTRVTRNSGRPILYNGIHGWADYFGIWIHGPEGEVPVTNGLQVTSEDGETNYTVFKGGGRLIKRTKSSITLGDLVGDSFHMWDDTTRQNFVVTWDGTNLVRTGTEGCNENGCQTTDIPDQNVALQPHGFIGLWKEGLGNLEFTVPATGKLSNDMKVPLYTESTLTPSSSELAGAGLTLKCYGECPQAPLTLDMLNAGTPFNPRIEDNTTAPYVYTISGSDMTLKKNGVAITIEDSAQISPSSPNFWGLRTGVLVPTSTTITNWYEIWNQDVAYIYETGPNPWNKYAGLLDSENKAVTFESPLYCLYEDAEHGTFKLDYHGEGRLFGIPFERVESDEDESFEHWVAQFVIPDGSELDCDGTPHFTKAMSIEQNMVEVDPSVRPDLSAGGISPPSNVFTDPEMDAAPTVTDAPKVILGEIQ